MQQIRGSRSQLKYIKGSFEYDKEKQRKSQLIRLQLSSPACGGGKDPKNLEAQVPAGAADAAGRRGKSVHAL